MNFFPTPYPDELLYSILARYGVRSGNISDIHNIEDLFGTRNCTAVMELATNLDSLIDNMPINTEYTAEYFIYNHTLFPYYSAFITKERAEQIIALMKSKRGDLPYIKLGLISSGIILNRHLRFCPECFKEDIEKYGEAYWHRIHQITGILVCPRHKVPILDSNVLARGGNRQKFVYCSSSNCYLENKISYSDGLIEKMIWIAEDAEVLLNNRFESKPQGWFVNQFRKKLIEKNYARMNNHIFQKQLKQDIKQFYGNEFLELAQSKISDKNENWLSNIVRNNDSSTYALRYLLLTRFLGMDLYNLLNDKASIEDNNSISDYEKLWEEMLKMLIQKKLSIREIAKILNTTPKTVRKHIDKMGIEQFWRCNGGGKYVAKKYVETEEFRIKKEETRERWIKLHCDNPNISSNQIRNNNDVVYAWLSKFDNEWLKKHIRKAKTNRNNVDWIRRDNELLQQVKNVVGEMGEGKPERISWSTIGSKLGVSGWLRHKDKLPLTGEYIETKTESLPEFQLRKIGWSIEQLENNGREITKWSLLEEAGVKERYIGDIKDKINEMLMQKGYRDIF